MTAPTAGTSIPPVWDATTAFQYSFEDNESSSLWDTYTNVTTQSTGSAADGDKYAVLEHDSELYKYINSLSAFWIRFCIKFSDTRDRDRDIFDLDVSNQHATLVKLEYLQATDKIKCHLTGKQWARKDDWQTIEYFIEAPVAGGNQIAYLWVDGTYIGSATLSYSPAYPPIDIMRATWGDEWAYTTIYLDAIKIDSFRPGLPGRIAPTTGGYVQDGAVELDGVAFNILENQYQEQDISGFAPRMGTGAPAYSDLSGFQHFLIPSWHNGIGQADMIGEGSGDENKYLNGLNVDSTGGGLLRLANGIGDTDTVADVPAYDVMTNGQIVSCDMAGKSVYGLKFGSAKASASYKCLFWRDGASLNSKAFTCTDGVQDVFYNGQYLFVTLGGASVRMQKTADLTTWSDVGNDSLPPVDMGPMAVYDEFLWVADRTQPIVYRAGQTDASDLAKETELGLGAHRVGPGSVPINSMCAFQGRLYVGRQDGLYAITQDADYVYVQTVETFPRSIYNYRTMTVYEGYLVYAVGRQVFRLGGITESGAGAKMDITPGPTSDTFPYTTISHWESFTVSNGYLFAVGYDDSEIAWVFCYNGSGWHRIYGTENTYGSAQYAVGLEAAPSSDNEPRIHWATCKNSATGGVFTESYASARMGAESPDTDYQFCSGGQVTTSWMSFGLPLVPKLFSLVRFDTEGLSSGSYLEVSYSIDTGQELKDGVLGLLVQNDANFLAFPIGTWGTKLQLKITLYRVGISDSTPIVHRAVVQYMDRPTAVWGYSMTLDLSSPARTQAGTSSSHTVESLRQHLRDCREKASYVRFVDADGNESDVFISSGPRFVKVNEKPAAMVTLMVVKRYINTPGVVGTSAA